MILIVSTLVMALLIAVAVIAERRHSRKSHATFHRYDEMLDGLSTRVRSRYVEKFGKDPTGNFPAIRDQDEEKK